MDNAAIQKESEITNLLDKCASTPPHSPFLNPIELLWSKVKSAVRREMLTLNVESAKIVAIQDYMNWIKHLMSFFDGCLALGANL